MRRKTRNPLYPFLITFFMMCHVAQAETTSYTLDSMHTHIIWEVDRFGFTKTMGSFTDIEGVLEYDPINPANSKVTASIALSGLRSDLKEREDIVRGVFWLAAKSHPVISFSSTSVVRKDAEKPDELTVTGDMTLKGKTHPLILSVVLNKNGLDPVSRAPALGFSATGVFDRQDFGINTAVGPVGKDVKFRIETLVIGEKLKTE